MIYSWPPTGRMSADYSQSDKAINFIPQSIDRRQGRLCGRARQSRACDRLQQGARGRLGQSGGRLSLHAVGDVRRRCRWRAACCPTRCAIPIGCRTSSRSSTARFGPTRQGLSRQPQQLGQCRPARHDHAGLRRTTLSASTGCAPRSGRAPIRRRRSRRRRPNGMRRPSGSASTRQKAFYRGVPEAARLLRRPYGREAGHGGEALTDTNDGRRAGHRRRPLVRIADARGAYR